MDIEVVYHKNINLNIQNIINSLNPLTGNTYIYQQKKILKVCSARIKTPQLNILSSVKCKNKLGSFPYQNQYSEKF
jgi:hypothetical protein